MSFEVANESNFVARNFWPATGLTDFEAYGKIKNFQVYFYNCATTAATAAATAAAAAEFHK